ncbi:MAG: hypothetical protein WC661_16560 [Opitutaceae bacterium]|jgi:hypothetical protein
MKLSSLLLICISALISASASAATPDPFGSFSQSWIDSIQAAKPLRLEICFGEIPITNPVTNAVTPEFLAVAKTLRIAVAPNDQGRIETPDALTAIYRLTTKGQAHSLDVSFSLEAGGRREINTSVTLTEQIPDKWIVIGGLTRTDVITTKGKTTETRKNLIIAVRLVSAKF